MCHRSISEKGEVTSVEEGRGVERTTETVGVCQLQLRRSSREIDESKSDVINTVEVPQIQYIDRAVDVPVVRGKRCFLFSQEACVCS